MTDLMPAAKTPVNRIIWDINNDSQGPGTIVDNQTGVPVETCGICENVSFPTQLKLSLHIADKHMSKDGAFNRSKCNLLLYSNGKNLKCPVCESKVKSNYHMSNMMASYYADHVLNEHPHINMIYHQGVGFVTRFTLCKEGVKAKPIVWLELICCLILK